MQFLHKKALTPIAQYFPQEGQSWFDTYFSALKHALMRAWNWKFLWLWGLLLPAGGAHFNMSGTGWDEEEPPNDTLDVALMSGDVSLFVQEHLLWIILGAAVVVGMIMILWIVSSVARWGLVQSVHEIQDAGKPTDTKIALVWHRGKGGVWRLMILDVIVMVAVLSAIFAVVALGVGLVLLIDSIGLVAMILMMLSIMILVPVMIVFVIAVRYISTVAVVIIALEDGHVITSLKKSWHLLRGNIREVGKLIITRLLLGMMSFGVFVAMAFMMLLVGGILVAIFFGAGSLLDVSDQIGFLIPVTLVGILFGGLCTVVLLVYNALVSLVTLDLWVWWVKRLKPELRKKQQETRV